MTEVTWHAHMQQYQRNEAKEEINQFLGLPTQSSALDGVAWITSLSPFLFLFSFPSSAMIIGYLKLGNLHMSQLLFSSVSQ